MTHTPNNSFRRAVGWAYAMTFARRGLSFALTFVLAALLAPEAFGVVAMALAFTVLVDLLVSHGLSAAIIQRKNLEEQHLDAAFWVIMGIAGILTALTVSLANWWAGVNDLPALAPVLQVLAISIPLRAFGVIPNALLQRSLNYKALALLGTTSGLISGAAGIGAAIAGFGVWALVIQHLSGALLTTAFGWRVSRWMPRLRFSRRHARDLGGFSGGMLLSQLGAWVASQADAIVMGLFFGPVAVGLYRLADRLVMTVLEVTTRSLQTVSLPHFSRLQDDPVAMRKAVRACLHGSASVTLPILGALVIGADALLSLLGDEWRPAAGALRILAILAATKAIALFTGPLLLAHGRSTLVAGLAWLLAIPTAGAYVLAGYICQNAAAETQLITIAATRVGVFVVLHGVLSIVLAWRLCGLSIRDAFGAVAPGTFAAACGIAAGAIVHLGGVTTQLVPVTAIAASIVALLATDSAARRLILGGRERTGALDHA